MVQGIRGLEGSGLQVSKVKSEPERSRRSEGTEKPKFDEVLAVSIENRQAAEARLEDVDSALEHAGQLQDDLQAERFRGLAAHRLDPNRVAELLKDEP